MWSGGLYGLEKIMAYLGNLGTGVQLYLENHGDQTQIMLISSTTGGQQSQSSSFETGNWLTPPTLYQTSTGHLLRINTAEGQRFIQISSNSLQILASAPSINNTKPIPLQQVTDTKSLSQDSMKFTPIKPMKMGDMSTSTNQMEMHRGNMSMRMQETPQSSSERRFCTQCGQPTKKSDRFCASCGTKLEA